MQQNWNREQPFYIPEDYFWDSFAFHDRGHTQGRLWWFVVPSIENCGRPACGFGHWDFRTEAAIERWWLVVSENWLFFGVEKTYLEAVIELQGSYIQTHVAIRDTCKPPSGFNALEEALLASLGQMWCVHIVDIYVCSIHYDRSSIVNNTLVHGCDGLNCWDYILILSYALCTRQAWISFWKMTPCLYTDRYTHLKQIATYIWKIHWDR